MLHSKFTCFALPILTTIAFSAMPTDAFAKGPRYTDPANADSDYAFQGEYVPAADGDEGPAAQVIALGKGEFEAAIYKTGLPGTQPKKETPTRVKGALDGAQVVFRDGENTLTVDGKSAKFTWGGETTKGTRIERKSPTLGLAPPENAHVLFDGSTVEGWNKGRLDGELLMQGTTSKQTFGSHRIHIEFQIPYQPEDRGQGRGNSGIYVQGRYEVQMLDSFGLAGKQNECGGLYSVKDPDQNLCLPPLTWQTYDIEYTAPSYEDGKLVENPRVTVRHNGVVIHDDVELPGNRSTTAAPVKPGDNRGPVYLQDHGCPVRYRNVWVLETE